MNTLEEALSETLKKLMMDNMIVKINAKKKINSTCVTVELWYDGELIDEDYCYLTNK